MQDQYVGDIGDFGKYGLLRALCRPRTSLAGISLGVVWYLVPNEDNRNDGRLTGYLKPSQPNRAALHRCDPKLYDCLEGLVNSGQRNVAAIREAAILPRRTVFYEAPLSYDGLPGRGNRTDHRASWLQGALETTKGCDIVFLDPDNGLESGTGCFAKLGPKYVYLDDVNRFATQTSGLIIYHHTGRHGTVEMQVALRFEQLRKVIGSDWRLFALRYRRGTSRVYFVLSSLGLHGIIHERISSFLETPWSQHFSLILPSGG